MSHFLTLVLVQREGTAPGELLKKEPEYVRAEVQRLLAPFDEAIRVSPYETGCNCVGLQALLAGQAQADRALGSWDAKRKEFRKSVVPQLARDLGLPGGEQPSDEQVDGAWEAFTAEFRDEYTAAAEAAARAHPLFGKPDPNCDDCRGSGVRTTTYNPRSRWDFWRIGGRWNGIVRDGAFREGPEGSELLEHNAAPVPELKENILEYVHAIVTPDGQWHERGRMGWWGMVHDPKPENEWRDEAARLLLAHREAVAVGCDLHI